MLVSPLSLGLKRVLFCAANETTTTSKILLGPQSNYYPSFQDVFVIHDLLLSSLKIYLTGTCTRPDSHGDAVFWRAIVVTSSTKSYPKDCVSCCKKMLPQRHRRHMWTRLKLHLCTYYSVIIVIMHAQDSLYSVTEFHWHPTLMIKWKSGIKKIIQCIHDLSCARLTMASLSLICIRQLRLNDNQAFKK